MGTESASITTVRGRAASRPLVRAVATVPTTVAATCLALYAGWLALFLSAGASVWSFVIIGRRFSPHAAHAVPGSGYDGQFSYFIAVDPLHAAVHMDNPGYRYGRIIYPLLAHLVTLGHASLVPDALIAINLVAIAAGTWFVAAWLRRRGMSPWLALIYGLFPGLFTAFLRDLTEPLAYCLVAAAVYVYEVGGRRGWLWSAFLFALAILTRETSVLFAAVFAAGQLVGTGSRAGRMLRAVVLLSISTGPYLIYRAWLRLALGWTGVPKVTHGMIALPFSGLLAPMSGVSRAIAIVTIFVPGIVALVMCFRGLRLRPRSVELWALAANLLVLVVLLNPDSYADAFGSDRVTTGVVLAALCCIPLFDRLGFSRRWLLGAAACWLSVAPVYFVGLSWWMTARP